MDRRSRDLRSAAAEALSRLRLPEMRSPLSAALREMEKCVRKQRYRETLTASDDQHLEAFALSDGRFKISTAVGGETCWGLSAGSANIARLMSALDAALGGEVGVMNMGFDGMMFHIERKTRPVTLDTFLDHPLMRAASSTVDVDRAVVQGSLARMRALGNMQNVT